MSKNLVIVESPAKAKTIEGFLGKDFTVKSCYGHVRDLSEKGISIEIEKNFLPKYEVSSDKKKLVSELKDLAGKADTVWLASDEDREGEAIAWHLYETLSLNDSKTRRIVFNEITKNAIVKAIEQPRNIDFNLVNAQQARRVLDRLVGYEISPVLWKKVKPSLSAGRVQSVAVRLIVERERERQNFTSKSYFRIVAQFHTGESKFTAELDKRFDSETDALAFLDKCKTAGFSIRSVETKPARRSPAPPFTTSTLQQEAGRKLGYSVSKTMTIAQKLYEEGKITYMRTDSVNLSDFALQASAEQISKNFGDNYVQTRKYTSKSKGAQEAHEAIRPTHFEDSKVTGDSGEQRLYELIWKRAVASQMADAKLEKTTVEIDLTNSTEKFIARGEVITFDGFLKLYIESDDEENEESDNQKLPRLSQGAVLEFNDITATQKFASPPARFTEASLVKRLEELGIGRPSTYAPTISTIQKRGYVEKKDLEGTPRQYQVLKLSKGKLDLITKTENTGAEKAKLFPTDIGQLVNDFLVENFKSILDYNFTAEVEKEFDEIAEGKMIWNEMIRKFYGPFHEMVEYTEKHSEKVKGKRQIGIDPDSGKNVYVLLGRYGPMAQIGEAEDEEKPKFASLRKEQSMDSVSLDDVLDLFKLPRTIGSIDGKEVVAGVGKFGPYIRYDSKFYSLPKGSDPLAFTLEESDTLIKEKKASDEKKLIKEFEGTEIRILNGMYGPYIAKGKDNFKIPKGTEAAALTLQECEKIIAEAPPKKKAAGKRK
jgi:DNA topoisomerase-1